MEKSVDERVRYQEESDAESYESGSDSDLEKAQHARRKTYHFQRRDAPSAYSSSSRETSGSHQHLLNTSPNKRKSNFYAYKIPQQITKYVCWALLSTLIIFVLCLIRASYTSSRQVEMGTVEKSPPKPPTWESFPFLKRYHGGIRTLVPKEANIPEYPHDEGEVRDPTNNTSVSNQETKPLPKSVVFDPYSKAGGDDPDKHECFLDPHDTIRIPKVHHYSGVVQGFPDAVMGSHKVLGLRDDICFERFGRLGPYGYGYSVKRGGTGAGLHGDREGADDLWADLDSIPEVDYSDISWAKVQAVCATKNAGRFRPVEKVGEDLFLSSHTGQEHDLQKGKDTSEPAIVEDDPTVTKRDPVEVPAGTNGTVAQPEQTEKEVALLPRTAVLIRTWWDYQYKTEDIIYLRSLITELSLLSGGEFTVHFLIHVRDDNAPIWQIRRSTIESSRMHFQPSSGVWVLYGASGKWVSSTAVSRKASSVTCPFMEYIEALSCLSSTSPTSIPNTTLSGTGRWMSATQATGISSSTKSANGQKPSLARVCGSATAASTSPLCMDHG